MRTAAMAAAVGKDSLLRTRVRAEAPPNVFIAGDDAQAKAAGDYSDRCERDGSPSQNCGLPQYDVT